MKKNLFVILKDALLWLLSLVVLTPLYLIVINSLKTKEEAIAIGFSLPAKFQWHNYIDVIKRAQLGRAFYNSLLVSSVSVVLGILVTSMAAFVLARNKSKLNKTIYNYFFLGLVAPLNYITTINVLKVLHIQNTFTGIILVYATLGIPFAMFLYYSFVDSIPKDLDEAAIIDGCGLSRLFFKIIFPLLKPVTITGVVLNFLGAWNDFTTPLYLLNSTEKYGMVNSIYNFFGAHVFYSEWNMILADIVLSVLPILILYILGQRYIIGGMTTGSVKG